MARVYSQYQCKQKHVVPGEAVTQAQMSGSATFAEEPWLSLSVSACQWKELSIFQPFFEISLFS